MAWGAIIGGLLGAGGQVAGGLLGQGTGGQGKTANYNPNLDLAIQAALFSGLDPIGFGDINSVPGPIEQLIGQINSSSLVSKTRNRALTALNSIRNDPSLLTDPYGKNFTFDEVLSFLKDPSKLPEGRKVADPIAEVFRGPQFGGSKLRSFIEEQDSVVPIRRIPRLDFVLKKLGMTLDDITRIAEDEKVFRDQIQQLEDAGLGGLQTDTIINRANAARTASELLGGAAEFARTGQPGNPLSQTLFARDERQLADLQDRLGVLANFGGINPAQLFKSLSDAKLDQNLRLIEQQLGMSNALQASLNPATAAASSIAGQSSNASFNAAQIAAQQAAAAAGLRANQASGSSSSLANGVGAGSSSLGSMFSNLGLLFGNPSSDGNTVGFNNTTDRGLASSSDVTGYNF